MRQDDVYIYALGSIWYVRDSAVIAEEVSRFCLPVALPHPRWYVIWRICEQR